MMLAAFLTVYFIEGEYVSFRVLALGHPSNTTRDHVVVALVAEGIFVALQPMWDILAWADRRLAAAIGRGAVEPVSHRRRYLLLGSLAAALFVVPVVTLLLWDLVASLGRRVGPLICGVPDQTDSHQQQADDNECPRGDPDQVV